MKARWRSKLGWFALQVPIIGLCLFAAYWESQETGQPAKVGLALFLGVFLSFGLTYALSFLLDRYRLLSVRWRGWRARRLQGHIDKPAGQSGSLTATGRGLSKLPESRAGLRVGE